MKINFCLVNYQVLFTILVWGILDEVKAFNVDDKKPIYFQEKENAMFGYTVAFIADSSGVISLLVGAPNRTGIDGIKGYGGFYECEINSLRQRGSCQRQETVDYMCQKFKTRYRCEDYQMLGATIAVNHKYQDVKYNMSVTRVSVCAPGWKYTFPEIYGKNFTLPVGKCYHFKETWQQEGCESEYEYCIPFWRHPDDYFLPDGTDNFALAMGGFSMKYSKDGWYSFIGGPGVKEGRGAVKSHQKSREKIIDRRKDGLREQYFGFSLTTADFKEHGSFTVGIPNYRTEQEGFTGRVEVFSMEDFTMKNFVNFGEATSCDGDMTVIPNDQPQSGSKFGYTVEGINVDNKGMDELFVGAPLYSELVMKRVIAPETGRVFVYRVTTEKICGPIVVLTGAASDPSLRKLAAYARFGTAISSAGDLNHDGYKDVAIGAPYEDEYAGAVYIYNGGADAVKDVFSQRITGRVIASNIPESNIQTFGWHINGEYDVDKNGFTDLAIGAYKNDVAIVLRTRPIVNVTMDIQLFPSIIPLNGTPGSACGDTPCLSLLVCFRYIAEMPAPRGVVENLPLQYDVELDTLAQEKNDPVRVKFQNDSNYGRKNITLVRSIDLLRGECRNSTIVVKKNGDSYIPNDLWTPVRFAINFTLLQPASDFSVLDPVLKPEVQSAKIVEANFDTKCENKTCLSDLELAAEVRFVNSSNWAPADENTSLKPGVVGTLCQDDQAPGLTRSNVMSTASGMLDDWKQLEIVMNKSTSEQVEYKNDPQSDRTLYILHRYHLINNGPSPLINATINITVPIGNNDKTLAVIVNASAGCVITHEVSDKMQMSSTTVGPTERTIRIIDSQPAPNQQRRKRDKTHGVQLLELTVKDPSKLDITCANYQCRLVRCNIGAIKAEEKKTVDVNINILEKNIPSDKSLREITYVSRAEVPDPYVNFRMADKLFAEKRTRLVISLISIDQGDISIWIIIGSVAGGILLLIIIIIILWKCGFFKRKQHQELQQYKRESLYKRKSTRMTTLESDKRPELKT